MRGFAGGSLPVISRFAARAFLFTVAYGLTSLGFAQESFLDRLLDRKMQVVTVTDMAPGGRLLREPSRERPVFYEALVLGYNDFGRTIAGIPEPDKKAMVKLILKVLGDRGYYPAKPQNPPEILLTFAWGTMNYRPDMAMLFMGADKLNMRYEMEGLSIGTAADALTQFRRGPIGDFIMEASRDPLYVLSIQAFDRQAALQGKRRLLWHTKVSCPAIGLDITPALQQMAREAARYVGRDTRPVLKTTVPSGRVDMGELKVLETIDLAKLPITDLRDEQPADAPTGD